MEIINAYDLTGSDRAAAELCGCSHHTVKKAVEERDAGLPPACRRARMIDDWRDVLEGWVTDSRGRTAATKPMKDCWRWDTPEPTAPPAVRWLKSNLNGDWAIHGCTDRGSPNPGCGQTTSETAPSSRDARSCFWWRGCVVPIPGRHPHAGSDGTECLRGIGPDLPHPGGAPPPAHRQRETVTTGHIAGVPVATAKPSRLGGTTASRC